MAEEVVVKKKRERIKRTAEKVELPASVASATTDTPLAETTQEPVKATKTRRKKVAEEVVPTTENVETTAAPTTEDEMQGIEMETIADKLARQEKAEKPEKNDKTE